MQPQPPGPGLPLQAPSVKRRTSTGGRSLGITRLTIVEQAARLLQQRRLSRNHSHDGLAFTEGDAATIEVVRRNLNLHFVTWNDTDEVLPHFPRNVSHHQMAVFQFDAELSVGQRLHYGPFNFNCFFFGHSKLLTRGTELLRIPFFARRHSGVEVRCLPAPKVTQTEQFSTQRRRGPQRLAKFCGNQFRQFILRFRSRPSMMLCEALHLCVEKVSLKMLSLST